MGVYQPARTPAEIADRDQARAAKLAALHATLTEQITALRTSADWQGWLKTAVRFHQYSFNNVLLIAAQCAAAGRPEPTAVAGFSTWKALGRQVNKGERAIAILAPVAHRRAQPETARADATPSTSPSTLNPKGPEEGGRDPVQDPAGDRPEGPSRQRTSFRVAHVFELSQTSGDPLPERPMPQLLAGQAPEGLWQALAEQVAARGFTLERADCGAANGVTDYVRRCVTVRPDLDDAAAVKTLSHELAHVLMHDPTEAIPPDLRPDPTGPDLIADPSSAPIDAIDVAAAGTTPVTMSVTMSVGRCRGRIEVEAESVAYLITASHGLDSAPYTFPYVAGWAATLDAATPESVVRATGERVLAAARIILAATEHLRHPTASVRHLHAQPHDQNLDAAAERGDGLEPVAPPAALAASAPHADQPAGQPRSAPVGLTRSSPPAEPTASASAVAPSPERLILVHQLAVTFYRAQLHASGGPAQPAVALLTARGVTRDQALGAQLGYAPPAWDALVEHLRSAGIDDRELAASGLVVQTSRGTLIDRFRDRIIFPIHILSGQTIALLGRAMDPTVTDRTGAPVPKYLNSPETAIYHKGAVLYGLTAAATAALRTGATPVLVEGPMDVLAVNAAGTISSPPAGAADGAASTPEFVGVAPCGTALTAGQVALLDAAGGGLAAGGVVTAFDGDQAGHGANSRAFELLRAVGAWPNTAAMPAGQDPALLFQQHGPAKLLAALHAAAGLPLADVVIDERITRYSDQLRWPEGRLSACRSAAGVIATLPAEQVGRQVARLAARLDLPTATVTDLVLEAALSPTHLTSRMEPRSAADPTHDQSDATSAASPPTAAQRAKMGFPVSLHSSLRPPPSAPTSAFQATRPPTDVATPVSEYRPRSA
jgi:DNA primase